MNTPTSSPSVQGWDITRRDDVEWVPWGQDDKARAKTLGSADGYVVVLVEAQTGYRGTPHRHAHAEFFYLIEGRLRNQGQELTAGDGYAAAAGSTHDDFEALTPSTYVSVFRV
jgi:quercetin dioxygenase-like cupin family protein